MAVLDTSRPIFSQSELDVLKFLGSAHQRIILVDEGHERHVLLDSSDASKRLHAITIDNFPNIFISFPFNNFANKISPY